MVAAETRAWKLRLRSPLHVSEQGVGLEETLDYVPSDSLFSALVVTWLEMGQYRAAVPQLLAQMKTDAPLLLTSAFPFAGDVLLLPKPNLLLSPKVAVGGDKQDTPESGKKYKKVRWVSVAIFEKLVHGIDQSGLNALWTENMASSVKIQGGTVWVTPAEKEKLKEIGELDEEDSLHLWREQNTPKVTVDRIANASALFHVGRLHFAPNCGLWLMARGEAEWLGRTEDALRLLADSGIGGQRSRGNGQFCLDTITPPELTTNTEVTEYDLLLSRVAPRQAEMPLLRKNDASYQLVTVGGFNGTPGDTPVVRKQVRLLTEGSLIGHADHTVGQLVDVTPDKVSVGHPIYRYGFGFTVPVQIHPQEAEA